MPRDPIEPLPVVWQLSFSCVSPVLSPGQGAVAISVLRVLVPTVWEMQTKDGIEASGGRWAKLFGLLAGIQLEMPPSVG